MEMTREELRVEENARETKNSNPEKNRGNTTVLLNEFAGYTTLHGFHFVLESCSLVRRILWATFIVLALVILAFQCLNGLNKLLEKDSLTFKEQERGETILFPAVTICNQNMLRKNKIMGTEGQKFLDDIESFLFNGFKNNTNETFNLDLDRVVRRAGHNISDMLMACFWQGRVCGVLDFYVFTSIRRGLCYTFNSGKPGYPLRYQSFAGRDKGLLLQLNAEPEQYYGPFNMLEGTGFRVMVHDQNDWPDVDNYGMDISPGFSSTIRLQRYKNIRLPPPYKSKCGEQKLASTQNYSHSACLVECWTRLIVTRCQCKVLGMVHLDELKSLRYCGPRKFVNCVIPANENSTVESICDCPTKCETVTFNDQLSSSSYPSRHVLPMLVKQLNATLAANGSDEFYDKIETELRRRILQLNVFYQSTVTEVTREKPAYDIHSFGSDIGGNMGLFLGCSLLTILEFIDLVILICLRNSKSGQKIKASL